MSGFKICGNRKMLSFIYAVLGRSFLLAARLFLRQVRLFTNWAFTDGIPSVKIFWLHMDTILPDKWFHLVAFYWVIHMEIKRLYDLREDADQSQQAIADYLNMHRSVYRRYENGERETPAWVVDKLADYYHVSTDYLLGRTDEPTPPPKSK